MSDKQSNFFDDPVTHASWSQCHRSFEEFQNRESLKLFMHGSLYKIEIYEIINAISGYK